MKLRLAAGFALLGWFLTLASNTTWAAQAGPRKISDLEFFIGNWIVQGEGVDFGGKAFKLQGRYSIERALDGAWLTTTGDFLGVKLREYWGYDAASRVFLRVGFQSNGTFSILRSEGWNVASLVWSGEVTGPDGQRTAIRSTQIREDNNDILVTWEKRTDSTWQIYSKERLCRVPNLALHRSN